MTEATRQVVKKWIDDNRMDSPINGAVYYSGDEELTEVGIDGTVDLSKLANLIECAERERCAKIADTESGLWDCGYEELANRIAAKIRSVDKVAPVVPTICKTIWRDGVRVGVEIAETMSCKEFNRRYGGSL